jgi:hypothetical protein
MERMMALDPAAVPPIPKPIDRQKVVAWAAKEAGITVSKANAFLVAYEGKMARLNSIGARMMQEREQWEFEVTRVVK